MHELPGIVCLALTLFQPGLWNYTVSGLCNFVQHLFIGHSGVFNPKKVPKPKTYMLQPSTNLKITYDPLVQASLLVISVFVLQLLLSEN